MMNATLRKLAVFIGLGLLIVSIFWSQDGFNFNLAGDSGGGDMALTVGWFLAISVSVVQFVFSTNFKDLNPSLILFGLLAYVYSIYTNYQGIIHFQGEAQSTVGAWILAFVMDGVTEPLIAWGLYESLSGDFVGNLIKSIVSVPNVKPTTRAESTVYQSIPKAGQNPQYRGREGTKKYQAEQRGRNSSTEHNQRGRGKPTYHSVEMPQGEENLPEFLKDRN